MLDIKNISYSAGKKNILHSVSFTAEKGQFIGILGPNGAGKSTLLKLISRELKTKQGSIFLNGQNIHQYSVNQMALLRAVMTQSIHVAGDFKAEEVVMMGRYPHFNTVPSAEDINAVDHCIQLTETQNLRERNYPSLSGGEQQRIQLARVMAQVHHASNSPKLLLLDEPLNNLDIKHQHKTLEIARDFAQKGNIVLAVLHDINLSIEYTDKLLLLHEGNCKAFGNAGQVIEETILSECYNFPVKTGVHPYKNCPVVYFGQKTEKENKLQNQLQHDTPVQI